MRIPWPTHFNLKVVFGLALALMVVQLVMGTSPFFAAGVLYFIVISTIAFNIAGGMNTFSGSFIGFMSLQTIILAQVAKVFLLQPADSHLLTPLTTISVYDTGMTCVAFAAFLSAKYKRKIPIFRADQDENRMVGMSIAASIIGAVCLSLVGLYGFQEDLSISKGDIFGMLNQFGGFLPLGVLLGTAHIIQQSRGARSARWWTILPIIFLTLYGVAVQSKSAIFQPLLMWLMVCAALGYKLNRKQIISLTCTAVFALVIVFPVVQYMRGSTRAGNIINRGKLVYEYLSDNSLLSIREAYIANEDLREESSSEGYFYYGTDKQMLDRLSLIAMEDAIIYRVEKSEPHGTKFMSDGILAMVPRVIWRDKARWEAGAVIEVNEMGREIGIIAPTDYTTFISFSLFGSTYYMVGWLLSIPLLFFVILPMFYIMDSFYGSIRTNLFCLFPVLGNMHGAPEFTPPAVYSGLIHQIILMAITIQFIRFVSPSVTIFLSKKGLIREYVHPVVTPIRAGA
jgi:hypothetical protein